MTVAEAAVPAWRDALRPYLEARALERRRVSYREVLDALAVPGPRQIGRLAAALETTMTEDVAAGRALRAAVVVSQAAPAVPRAGFFAKARELGRYAGPDTGPAAEAFHAQECAALFSEVADARQNHGREPAGPPEEEGPT